MDYQNQWQMIMNDSFFTEEFDIQSDTLSCTVRGIFFSGSHEEISAPYATPRYVTKDFLTLSSNILLEHGFEYPFDKLKKAIVTNPKRGDYRVADISGAQSGVTTLSLQPVTRHKTVS